MAATAARLESYNIAVRVFKIAAEKVITTAQNANVVDPLLIEILASVPAANPLVNREWLKAHRKYLHESTIATVAAAAAAASSALVCVAMVTAIR
ncbi:hypothetical protein CF319_g8819 [Tilletia indica]|nr:hypothetical protein CF319_g8819 [Tilletia indica]